MHLTFHCNARLRLWVIRGLVNSQQRSIAATRYHVAEREFDVLVTNFEVRKDFIDTKSNYMVRGA